MESLAVRRAETEELEIMSGLNVALLIAAAVPAAALAGPRGWAKTILAERTSNIPTNAAARFSLYPRVTSDTSLKTAIKTAVGGMTNLGLHVDADAVSSLIYGPQDGVFEALEGSFTRAAFLEGRPHVSMQFTVSSAGIQESFDVPERAFDADEWVAHPAISRIACQFNVYSLCELGTCEDAIQREASQSSSFVACKPLCTMLDGDGEEVFRVLKECFLLATGRSTSGHVVLTATLTANLSKWKASEVEADDTDELSSP